MSKAGDESSPDGGLRLGGMQQTAVRRARMEWFEDRINEIQLVVGEDGSIVEINDQAVVAYGYEREELLALTIYDLRVASAYSSADQLVATALARGGVRFESEHRRKSGAAFPVEVSCRAFRSGRKVLLHCIIRDLSERRKTEREQALLVGLIRNMHDAVLVTDDQLCITTYTGAARQMYGWDAEEVLGKSVQTDLEMEFPDGDGEVFRGSLRGGRHCRASVRVRRKDGSWIDLDMVADALRDTAGRVTGYFFVSRDFSILREAARTLRESERRLSLAFAGSQDGVWDVHIPSGMAYFSERCRELLGFGIDEAFRPLSSWLDRIHGDDRPGVNVVVTGFLTGCDTHIDIEYRVTSFEGRETWLQGRGKIVEWDAEGHPVRAAGTLTDVSARRAAGKQLKDALRENERLVAELRAALDNVKTLSGLVPICAWCKKIRNDTGYWEQVEEYIVQHTEAQVSHGICPECFSLNTPKRR